MCTALAPLSTPPPPPPEQVPPSPQHLRPASRPAVPDWGPRRAVPSCASLCWCVAPAVLPCSSRRSQRSPMSRLDPCLAQPALPTVPVGPVAGAAEHAAWCLSCRVADGIVNRVEPSDAASSCSELVKAHTPLGAGSSCRNRRDLDSLEAGSRGEDSTPQFCRIKPEHLEG